MNRPTCRLDGCNMTPLRGYGWCHHHRENWKKYGTPTPVLTCSAPGCDRSSGTRDLCTMHYQRLKLTGVLYRVEPLPAGPLLDYIAARGGLRGVAHRVGVAHGTADYERWEKTIDRARRTGRIKVSVADQAACELLRVHPSAVYGDTWWAPAALEDAS